MILNLKCQILGAIIYLLNFVKYIININHKFKYRIIEWADKSIKVQLRIL